MSAITEIFTVWYWNLHGSQECHQRSDTKPGKGDLDTSKFPQQLGQACYVKAQRCQDT